MYEAITGLKYLEKKRSSNWFDRQVLPFRVQFASSRISGLKGLLFQTFRFNIIIFKIHLSHNFVGLNFFEHKTICTIYLHVKLWMSFIKTAKHTGFQEAGNNDNGRASHSAWRNYDDFNEYFW